MKVCMVFGALCGVPVLTELKGLQDYIKMRSRSNLASSLNLRLLHTSSTQRPPHWANPASPSSLLCLRYDILY
uniref:Uncharacterized protein n=1 Tax=Anguilla anguilla TaxID=7936 RepID=A0A0E9TGQ1_ANGAN